MSTTEHPDGSSISCGDEVSLDGVLDFEMLNVSSLAFFIPMQASPRERFRRQMDGDPFQAISARRKDELPAGCWMAAEANG